MSIHATLFGMTAMIAALGASSVQAGPSRTEGSLARVERFATTMARNGADNAPGDRGAHREGGAHVHALAGGPRMARQGADDGIGHEAAEHADGHEAGEHANGHEGGEHGSAGTGRGGGGASGSGNSGSGNSGGGNSGSGHGGGHSGEGGRH